MYRLFPIFQIFRMFFISKGEIFVSTLPCHPLSCHPLSCRPIAQTFLATEA